MKSQVIKIRNIPFLPAVQKTVHVKPVLFLLLLMIAGFVLITRQYDLMIAGCCMILLSVFAMLFMPDRILVQFTSDYMILYNTREKDECTLVYWDEIVSWQYEWHTSYDTLAVTLTDGSTQTVDMFSKHSIQGIMKQYAAGKEKKTLRTGKAEQA